MGTLVELNKIGPFRFEAKNANGKLAIIDGPAKIGGTDDGVRPMEMVLMGLAGCAVMDTLVILNKQKQVIDELKIIVDGERSDATPSPFNKIHLKFIAKGQIDANKLQKAITMSIEKYCSVAVMLEKSAEITWESQVLA